MKFGTALMALESERKVTRKGWNGKGMWLELQKPDKDSKMTLPYIYLNYPKGEKYPEGARVPWLPSQTDILADDWDLVKDEEHESSKKKPVADHAEDIVDMFIAGLLLHMLKDEMNCDECEKKENCPIAKPSEKKEGNVNEPGKTGSK